MLYDAFVSNVLLDRIKKIPIHYNLEIGNWLNDNSKISECEEIFYNYISNNGPNVEYKSAYPKYNLASDTIIIPKIENFQSSFEYYYILFHELSHSTIKENRMSREIGLLDDSFEEIVAEFSSAYITSIVLKEIHKYSSSYIRHHSESSNILGGGELDIRLGSNIAISVGEYILKGGRL